LFEVQAFGCVERLLPEELIRGISICITVVTVFGLALSARRTGFPNEPKL